MAVTRPGTQTTLWVHAWDGVWPEPGDFLRTPPGACYRIDEVRGARFGSAALGSFVVTRLDKDAVKLGQPGVFEWRFGR